MKTTKRRRYRRRRSYAEAGWGPSRARLVRNNLDHSGLAVIAIAHLALLVLGGIAAVAIGLTTGQDRALYGGLTMLGLMGIVYLLLRD